MDPSIGFFVRSAFNYDTDVLSLSTGYVDDSGEDVVQQSAKDDADINVIVRRFGLSGQLPAASVRAPTYGDFTGVSDFHSAVNAVAQANESFSALPPDVRFRFHNDPQMLLDFCADPANLAEARKLGLAMPEDAVKPPAEAISPGGSTPTPPAGAAASTGS